MYYVIAGPARDAVWWPNKLEALGLILGTPPPLKMLLLLKILSGWRSKNLGVFKPH